MTHNLHQRLAQFSSLDCEVAKRFSDRPTLLESAEALLLDQWRQRLPLSEHDPRQLFLDSRAPHTDHPWVRPLAQVLVERYCQGETLNLNVDADFLTTRLDSKPSGRLAIDLHEIEQLINDTGPLLLDMYRQQLVSYWHRFDSSGQTPWRWYANYLGRQMQQAIDSKAKAGNWPSFALAMARLVHTYPAAASRSIWQNTRTLSVAGLAADFSADGDLDVDLASTILIEHVDADPARNLTLLYTLSGKLLRFESRQTILAGIHRYRDSAQLTTPYRIEIDYQFSSAFDSQALGLLRQQLHVIDQLGATYHGKFDAVTMGFDLDRLTSLIDICNEAETAQRQSLSAQLPDWLRNAKSRPLMRYSTLLVSVAQSYQEANGQFWLKDVPDAEAFANQQMAARFKADNPGTTCTPEQVRITNYQVIAAALPVQGSIATSNKQTPVTFTCAQLAIGNLGLLKPGRVTLTSTTATPLPAWLTEAYLRKLVTELDIATAYPALLRSKLLDDVQQRAERQGLLMTQLRTQLPALAMELYLQGKITDPQVAEHIAQAFAQNPANEGSRWVIRRLGFIKAPGSATDFPRNTWLIEPQTPAGAACLLYRPLHEDSLLYFNDRLALFVAISTPGALQDDLLYRLPVEDRRFYAHGGFLEPHLFVPLDDTSAIPFGTPPAVTLALEPPPADLGEALYLACVNESIVRFEEASSSTAQTRWDSWVTLGWLMFNTLLPLAGSTLGKVAWLTQMEVALAEFVNTDAEPDSTNHELAMVNLLVNIAMLLFSHSLFRLRLEEDPLPSALTPSLVPPAPEAHGLPANAQLVTALQPLDFGWSSPDKTLSDSQQKLLDRLQASVKESTLGSPVPTGELQGLYLHGARLYTTLEHTQLQVHEGKTYRIPKRQVYEVQHDPERLQMRIVGPDLAKGPWLQRDELGRWGLDLALYVKGKGGMPISEQLNRMRLDKQDALAAADALIKADKDLYEAKAREMVTIEGLASATTEDTPLSACQTKLDALATFWSEHLEHIKARNALEPVKNFRMAQASALRQENFCQLVLHKVLRQRFEPCHKQLLQLVEQQQWGQTLTEADVRIATQRLDQQAQLLEQMLKNNANLRYGHAQLSKLAGPRFELIVKWRDLAASVPANAQTELTLRFQRMENQINRLKLVHELSSEAASLRDRCWDNLQLGVAQYKRVLQLPQEDAEANVRLLFSIKQQLQTAHRQLNIVIKLVPDAPAQETVQQLHEELERVQQDLAHDLAELPDYPPVSTLGQLRRRLPGLIETSEHGVLLTTPRADDAMTVDLLGPDGKTTNRTYHFEQDDWVELKPAKAKPRPDERSLKRLLKDGVGLLDEARKEVEKVRRANSSYLPIEIEESILHQRDRLLEQAEAIETRLTRDNATDEGVKGVDAEGTARALRTLAESLSGQATTLRVETALKQKPRMTEVQFLIGQGQVQLARVGTRVRLARVKGRPADFLDEYSISHDGKVLWYAHFHYPAMDTAKTDFTVGHLKTSAQRHAAGSRVTEANGAHIEVYRAPITTAAASAHFFNL